jgi:hypothetical protein
MSTIANPISGYYGASSQPYHSSNPGKYNRTVLASATFIATGSNAGCVAFYQSGSAAATVTLLNGGTLNVPAIGANAQAAIYEMGVYSVTAGSVYLLYR